MVKTMADVVLMSAIMALLVAVQSLQQAQASLSMLLPMVDPQMQLAEAQ
jgi:hypothetical protein